MNEQKHTPGPWTATIGTRGAYINVNNDYNHPLSFGFRCSEFDTKLVTQMTANAHLIAAAPDLLEACKGAIEAFEAEAVQGEGDWEIGMFCGLEDQGITDRYMACHYGYDCALERVQEWMYGFLEAAIEKAEGNH